MTPTIVHLSRQLAYWSQNTWQQFTDDVTDIEINPNSILTKELAIRLGKNQAKLDSEKKKSTAHDYGDGQNKEIWLHLG